MRNAIIAIFATFIFSICFLNPLKAQQSVENSTYALMLKTLLSHSVEEISAEEAAKLENALFLDAREKEEFEVSHIEDAKWIGYDDFKPERVADLDKNQHIVVYCSVGYRSEKITEQLLEMGFTDVQNLYGGVFEWVNIGNEVVNESTEMTQKVHAYDRIWGVWLRIAKEFKVY